MYRANTKNVKRKNAHFHSRGKQLSFNYSKNGFE